MNSGILLVLMSLPVFMRPDSASGDFLHHWSFSSTIVGIEILLCGICALLFAYEKKRLLQFFSSLIALMGIVVIYKHSYSLDLEWANLPISMLDNNTWRMAPVSLLSYLLLSGGLFILARRASPSLYEFTGLILISLSTAIGWFALLGKLFRSTSTFGWGNYALMSYPTAVTISFFGLAILLTIYNRLPTDGTRHIYRTPILTTFGIFVLATLAWKYFLDHESLKLRRLATFEVGLENSLLSSRIREYGLSLTRMARRLDHYHLDDRALIKSDATQYIKHLKGMVQLGIIERSGNFLWVYPKEVEARNSISDETFKGLDLSHAPVEEFTLSPLINSVGGVKHFILSSELAGTQTLFAVVDAETFLRSIVRNQDFNIVFEHEGREIFNNGIVGVKDDFWSNREVYKNKNLEIDVKLTPTKSKLAEESSLIPSMVLLIGVLIGAYTGCFLFLSFISQAEKNRRINEQKKFTNWQRAIFDSANVSMISTDVNGLIQTFNATAERMLGYSAAEMIQRETPQRLHLEKEIIEKARELSETYGESIRPGFEVFSYKSSVRKEVDENEWTYVRKDGGLVPVNLSITPILNESEEITGYLGIATDLSEKKMAFSDLQATTKKLKALINSSPVGIISMDTELNVSSWNAACEKIFGWSETETLGKYPPFVTPDQMVNSLAIIEKMKLTRAPITAITERSRKDGTLIVVESTATPLYDDLGNFEGILVVSVDVTQKIALEKEILEKNQDLQKAIELALRSKQEAIRASHTKSEFLANMSHEIRTPINGIIGMTNLVLDTNLSPEQKDYAESIKYSGDALLSIINDILDFSKVEAGKLTIENSEFDLMELLTETYRTFHLVSAKKEIGIELIMDWTPSHLFIGDDGRIRQILVNLLGNALKFTSQGSILIKVIDLAPWPSGLRQLRFEVIDQGIGISDEVQLKLFTPFEQGDSGTTRKYGGTGLGLSICKKLVELLGGEIGVISKIGFGSTFWFDLPLRVGREIQLDKKDKESQVEGLESFKDKRVLVAEDNLINQKVILKQLEKLGVKALAVANGYEVLSALEGFDYDLILMDCQMPELDGYETSRMLRNKNLTIPILALTANAVTGDREKCLEAGMDDYLIKPINIRQLTSALEKYLNQSSPAPVIEASTLESDEIDWTAIKELEELEGDDPQTSFLLEHFNRFRPETAKLIDKLLAMDLSEDLKELKRQAHILKSTSGNIGATELSRIAQRIELSTGADEARGELLILEESYRRFISKMLQYLKMS
jgi:PAS domain S-box-containing protein